MLEKVTAPMESINQINPNLLAVVLGLLMVAATVFMLIYLPRIDALKKTESDRDKYKAQRDYYINALSIELIKSGHTDAEVKSMMASCEEKITEKENRAKQASKRSKIFAAFGDKLRGLTNV